MKTIHLSIIVAVSITVLTLIGFYVIRNLEADASKSITLTDITINPKILYAGDNFTMNVTVNNKSTQTIYFFTDQIYPTFDKNVVISHYGGCSEAVSGNILMPSQSKKFTLPTSGCHYYVANSSGIVNALITLRYDIQKSEYLINASKEFTIFQVGG